MESHADAEDHVMAEGSSSPNLQINPKRARFPCCIVWTPLPLISWFVPFMGHLGICREDGVILDFAGPNFVCIDNFSFGAVARYLQISKEKCSALSLPSFYKSEDQHWQDEAEREISTWDDALQKGTQEYQHHTYSLFTCNCHSFVANSLNRLRFSTGGWNVVNLAALIFIKGKWVSKAFIARSVLPSLIVYGLGLAFGGSTFLMCVAIFIFLLVGWFLVGTYCFKNLIQL